MPQVLDLSKETDATLKLYGMERGATTGFGWQCIVARRMMEQGVRFVELIDVGLQQELGRAWRHSHARAAGQEYRSARRRTARRPEIARHAQGHAGGLHDRVRPFAPARRARWAAGHYNRAYSSWLAGGGVKGGITYGKTDDFGAKIVENECHVHDFHATILHCLGFDHTKLTFRHAGRDYRLTDVAGRVVQDILV